MSQLCPNCHNAADYCECDPPFAPGPRTEAPIRSAFSSAAAASPAVVERLLAKVRRDRRTRSGAVADGLRSMGCWFEPGEGDRRDYANVRPPRNCGTARLCSVTLGTGRVEFQNDSYALAESIGVAHRFDYLAGGGKAAINPDSDEDVAAILALAQATLDAWRGR